jgi:xanthine dehydrogenase accessory factor
MENAMEFYKTLVEQFEKKISVVNATVISRSGSGPREPGATMLILPDGRTVGTIGGGALEAQIVNSTKSVFKNATSLCETVLLTEEHASEEGMLCGGKVEILVNHIDASDELLQKLFRDVLHKLKHSQPVLLITSISDKTDYVHTGVGFISPDTFQQGNLIMSGVDQKTLESKVSETTPSLIGDKTLRYFYQPLHPPDKVYIFGAGHIGEALAPICAHVDLYPIIVDDRKAFANKDRFPDAADIRVIDTYTDALKNLFIDEKSYLVIVTRGHVHDQTVLAQALGTKAKYIGMIGSRKKRDTIYAALKDSGVTDKELKRVHCPIGLDIGALTPAEIAVSIAAEIIAVRAGQPTSHKTLNHLTL